MPSTRYLRNQDRRRLVNSRVGSTLGFGSLVSAFSPGRIVLGLPGIRNPLGIEGLPNAYKPVQVLMLVLIAVSVVSLLMRRVYARGVERQQTKWFTYTTAVAAS